MTKNELIEQMAAGAGITKAAAKAALDTALNAITNCLAEGGKVQLPGFGTFETRQRAARPGMTPQTKNPVSIPAATVPAFKAGKGLKDSVDKK